MTRSQQRHSRITVKLHFSHLRWLLENFYTHKKSLVIHFLYKLKLLSANGNIFLLIFELIRLIYTYGLRCSENRESIRIDVKRCYRSIVL